MMLLETRALLVCCCAGIVTEWHRLLLLHQLHENQKAGNLFSLDHPQDAIALFGWFLKVGIP